MNRGSETELQLGEMIYFPYLRYIKECNFYPLEAVSRRRDPQLQVGTIYRTHICMIRIKNMAILPIKRLFLLQIIISERETERLRKG